MSADFENLFQKLLLPAGTVDKSEQVISWNPAMHQLTGHPPAKAQGQSLQDLGAIAQALSTHWQERTTIEPHRGTLYIKEQVYIVQFVPLDNEQWAFVVERHPQLEHVSQHGKDMLYTIVHDLQNPLAAIKGYVDLALAHGTVNERQEHFLNRVITALQDMSDLVTHLLDIAWIDSGMTPQRVGVNLAHLVHGVASGHTERARRQEIALNLQLQPVPHVAADERRIKQVVDNLISNAIKYTKQGSATVRVYQEAGRVHVEVQDTGIGITQDELPHIFERFYRVKDTNTQDIDGNGLGLAICYEILQRHDETLHVESTYGQGTRFSFSLPVLE